MTDLLQHLNWTLPPTTYTTSFAASLTLLILSEANAFYAGSAGFKVATSSSFLLAGIAAASQKLDLLDVDAVLAPENRLPVCLVLGLALSFLGDALLIPSPAAYHSKKTSTTNNASSSSKNSGTGLGFKLGTIAFALAHVSYIVGFFSETGVEGARWNMFSPALMVSVFICHVLGPLQTESNPDALITFPKEMQFLGMSYMCIIIVMVSTATATDQGTQKVAGAWMFMVSDLFVAWDAFGRKKDVGVKGEEGKKDVKGKAKVQVQASGSTREGWIPRSIGWILYFSAQMLLAGAV